MSDDQQAPGAPADGRGAVARLAEALAAAQAVAREHAAELDDGPQAPGADAVDTTTAGSAPSGGPADVEDATALRDRISALPALGDDPDPEASRPSARSAGDRQQAEGGDSPGQDTDGPVADDEAAGGTETGGSGHHGSADRGEPAARRRARLWPLHLAMAVLILAVPALVYTGYRIVSDSTAGEVLRGRSDPGAPGYTALVEPTPTALIMHVTDDGQARGLTVLSLSGPDQRGGAVVAVPVNIRLRVPRYGIRTVAGIVAVNRTETAGRAIGSELGLGFSEIIEVSDSELVTLVEPVAPLRIENPEAVTRPDGTVVDEGPVELDGADIPAYLAAADTGNTVSGRLARQRLVWEAWITAVGEAGGAAAVPGESDVGLGRFLGQLAAGDVQTASFPVTASPPIDDQPVVEVDHERGRLLIANAVPFPTASVPGDRATVALLNGTGPGEAPASVIQRLTYAGAQITTMGNASTFGTAETTLTYTETSARVFAEAMAKWLGTGRVVRSDSADTGVDVAVVLGTDLLSDPPGSLTLEEVVDD